jgi:tetratricopeptide (TPR) repeat protein
MPTSAKPTLPAPTLALIVCAVMIVLYGVDKFLAAQERSELDQSARDRYTSGQQQIQAGKPQEAIADFARAHVLARSNREYQLALAGAQIGAGESSAARDTLAELLDSDSNDGRANLMMARVLASEDRLKEADSYYHRAIYGAWPAASSGEPSKARMELADLLAAHGNNQELLSELLLLQSSPTPDPSMAKHVADLFLQAGSPARAADAYKRLIEDNPADVDAYLGLGRAEVLEGNYRSAENAVMSALRRSPYDARIQSQLRLVVNLASLDPTTRRLTTAEKFRRSDKILRMVQEELNACRPNSQRVDKPGGPPTNENAEARLDQAEELWMHRGEVCKDSPTADDPLPLLMKKLL